MKDAQYDVDFFRSFDLVMNGLDNLEARRHVNRLCLAAETPLIESGTAGYLGQVLTIWLFPIMYEGVGMSHFPTASLPVASKVYAA